MKYMKSIKYIGLVLLFSTFTYAQKAVNPFRITNTPKGIFVEFGSKELIGKNLELFRKASNETTYKSIAKITAPNSLEDVKVKLFQAADIFVEGSRPTEIDLDKVWTNYQAKNENLIGFISNIPQLEYLFGLAYLDKEVRPNVKYQYQLTDGRNVLFSSVNAVVYLKQKYFPALKELSQSSNNKLINFEFTYPRQLFMSTKFEVKRKLFTNKGLEYQIIKPLIVLPDDKSKPSIILSDTSLTSYALFNYQIKMSDIFGNVDTSTYYFEGSNIPRQLIPEIMDVKIVPSKENRAFVLTWKLSQKDYAQSVALFRSRDFDGKFESIARFNNTDEIYTNTIEVANELYFYYFEVIDIFGKKSKTIKYQKVYEGEYIPTPPFDLSAKDSPKGVELSWQSSDRNTRGFYVFRKEGEKGDFSQISPIILIKNESGTFIDSTKLDAESTYYYAIKAESDTYDKSVFSDTLSYRAIGVQIKSQLKAPIDLNLVYRDDKVMITWENLNAEYAQILGYQVFRKSESERDFKLISPEILPFIHNYFVDSSFLSESKYQYIVKSTDAKKFFSEPSLVMNLDLTDKFLMLPDELGFEKKEKSIVLKWTEIDETRIKNVKIYRAESDGPVKLISTIDRKLRKFEDKTVSKGKTYIYQISTLDLIGKEGNRTEPVLITY